MNTTPTSNSRRSFLRSFALTPLIPLVGKAGSLVDTPVQPEKASRPVEVKPLEWTLNRDPYYTTWNARYGDAFNRTTLIGGAHKSDNGFRIYLSRSVGQYVGLCEKDGYPTLESAQAAVQEHWEAFIKGALTTAPTT